MRHCQMNGETCLQIKINIDDSFGETNGGRERMIVQLKVRGNDRERKSGERERNETDGSQN